MSDKTTDPVGDTVAKFFVAKIEMFPGQEGGSVTLSPVSRGSRNATWASATPSGIIQLTINNPAAFAQFAKAVNHVGGPEFLVHFSHAPQAHAGDGHPFEETPAAHYNHPRCAECGEPGTAHTGVAPAG